MTTSKQDAPRLLHLAGYLTIVGSVVACSRASSQQESAADVSATAKSAAPAASTSDACPDGDFRACARRGWAHYTGEGAPLDHRKAHELFQVACDHGVEVGCVPLGFMYQQGDIVPKDLDRAVALLEPACERGKVEVCSGLGELYEKERGDPASALVYFEKACAGGYAEACAAAQRLKAQ